MARTAAEKLADERHSQVLAGISGINERLDRLNGRVGTSEVNLATLTERVENMRPAKAGGIAGTIASIATAVITYLLTK